MGRPSALEKGTRRSLLRCGVPRLLTIIENHTQYLVHFFSETSWLERVWAAEQARQAQTQDKRAQDLEDIKKSLAGKEAEADELVEMVRHITTAAMRTKLEKQINEVGQELEILQKEKAALEHSPLNRETLESNRQAFLVWAEQALGGLEASDVEKKRVALYWLGVDVVLFRSTRELVYEVTLTWRGLNAAQPLILRKPENAVSSMWI